MIKKIVVAAGGLVQTSRENVLICRPEYPDSVNTWATADPCLVLADQDSFFSITPSPSLRSGYNKFFISNEDAQTDGLRMEDLQITASRREVRVFMVPWDDSAKIVLRHSGGSWVQIVADGVVTNEESQEVEFVSGAGQVAKPYYGDLVVDYKERGLGNVIADEDGTLTAAVVDHSLAQVGYLTKYHRFYVTDTKTENVQVYPEVTYD